MAKTVKMCDMSKYMAARVFQMLNGGKKVQLKDEVFYGLIIVTDIEPKDLVYPEGWYYAKGCLRNKHTCTSGVYDEIPLLKSNGDEWRDSARYCTLERI